jgi:hypothetical protein
VGQGRAEIAPEVSRHLDRFRDGLLAVAEMRGLYLYGSLTTGGFTIRRQSCGVASARAAALRH